jgi:hypothetical protein
VGLVARRKSSSLAPVCVGCKEGYIERHFMVMACGLSILCSIAALENQSTRCAAFGSLLWTYFSAFSWYVFQHWHTTDNHQQSLHGFPVLPPHSLPKQTTNSRLSIPHPPLSFHVPTSLTSTCIGVYYATSVLAGGGGEDHPPPLLWGVLCPPPPHPSPLGSVQYVSD